MTSLFATVSLSFDDKAKLDRAALAEELQTLGLGQHLKSTEGGPVELPQNVYAGQITGPDRLAIHRSLHHGLNAILKKLSLHGRFFIETSVDQDWSCCFF